MYDLRRTGEIPEYGGGIELGILLDVSGTYMHETHYLEKSLKRYLQKRGLDGLEGVGHYSTWLN